MKFIDLYLKLYSFPVVNPVIEVEVISGWPDASRATNQFPVIMSESILDDNVSVKSLISKIYPVTGTTSDDEGAHCKVIDVLVVNFVVNGRGWFGKGADVNLDSSE